MGNPKLIPYETIVRATSGEPEAVEEVLRHYSRRIRLAALENGHVNTDTEDKVIFIFHLPDGFRRYEVKDYDNDEVLGLCEKLCDCKFESIKQMLSNNSFYRSIIR